MNSRILKYLSFGLTVIMVVVLMTATIIEKFRGTTFVREYIYSSVWFVVFWAVISVLSLSYILSQKLHKSVLTFLIHFSFLLILGGAFITWQWGEQGRLRLRLGEPGAAEFILPGGGTADLPFAISLDDFQLEYYPATTSPMDFISKVSIWADGVKVEEGEVSMNKIFRYKSYRFYQSSYDADRRGSILSVAHDPVGIGVTYAGYLCLLVSMIGFFFSQKTGFRTLLRSKVLKGAMLVGLFALSGIEAQAAPRFLPKEVAAGFGDIYIYYNGRVCPLETVAKDFTVKIYGKASYRGLTPEQVLTGWFFFYDTWKDEPMIKIKGDYVRSVLGIEGKYAALSDFVDDRSYLLEEPILNETDDARRKALGQANEKFNIISMVATGSIFRLFPYKSPTDGQVYWYSLTDRLPPDLPSEQFVFIRSSMDVIAEEISARDYKAVAESIVGMRDYQRASVDGDELPSEFRFKAECFYNTSDYTKPLAMFCATLGILAFLVYCGALASGRKVRRGIHTSMLAIMGAVLVYLTLLISLRWIISGHLPLSNGYETMQFMAWCSLLLAFFAQRRYSMAVPFGTLMCGLTLLVAMMGQSNPQITLLMPVLHSPFLSIHVMVVMVAYCLLAFMMLNGVTACVLKLTSGSDEQIIRLQVISQLMLYVAVFCLAIGIFIGAVWANVSWGRYWGWDPKEVWALITMMIYSFLIHSRSLKFLQKPMNFHIFCIVAFLSVLITYFGVNFILGGMHSYA